ncbi:MAG: hypothetical protein J3K34DRAFT_456394 [Monoraphidium minutum]|nr:MAG: hypothetical protein J3K34DRAFT_456394 [Monoraphidium minutum]
MGRGIAAGRAPRAPVARAVARALLSLFCVSLAGRGDAASGPINPGGSRGGGGLGGFEAALEARARAALRGAAQPRTRATHSASVRGTWVEPICNPAGPYCGGGGGGDWLSQAQCSGYPLKPSNHKAMADKWCAPNSDVISNFAGAPNGAGVWRYRDPVTKKWADDYYVIHGCDGAGLMGDCKLGVQYFEHIYPKDWVVDWSLNDAARYSDPTAFNDAWAVACTRDAATGRWDTRACNAPHVRRPFRHPGTGGLHQADAGMWDWSSIKDVCNDRGNGVGDCGKPWSANMPFGAEKTAHWYRGVARELNGGVDPVAVGFVVTYPWVCNKWGDGRGGPKKWGTGGNWRGMPADGSLMDTFWGGASWGGSPPPYSPNQRFVECYFDNEPYDVLSPSAHGKSPFTPPAWEAFMFYKPKAQGSLMMLRIGKKAFSDAKGRAYSRSQLLKPGPHLFELQWVGSSKY